MRHLPDRRGRISGMEDRTAGNQNLRAGADHLGHVSRANSSIHFDPVVIMMPIANFPQLPYFFRGLGNERLPAEPRIDRHDQHMVDLAQHFREHRHRRGRIDHGSGLQPCSRTIARARSRWGVASWCTEIMSAPALAKASMYCSGFSIIRCTSSWSLVALRSDATTGTPMEIFGTK